MAPTVISQHASISQTQLIELLPQKSKCYCATSPRLPTIFVDRQEMLSHVAPIWRPQQGYLVLPQNSRCSWHQWKWESSRKLEWTSLSPEGSISETRTRNRRLSQRSSPQGHSAKQEFHWKFNILSVGQTYFCDSARQAAAATWSTTQMTAPSSVQSIRSKRSSCITLLWRKNLFYQFVATAVSKSVRKPNVIHLSQTINWLLLSDYTQNRRECIQSATNDETRNDEIRNDQRPNERQREADQVPWKHIDPFAGQSTAIQRHPTRQQAGIAPASSSIVQWEQRSQLQ